MLFPNPQAPLLPFLLLSLSFSFLIQTMSNHAHTIIHSFHPFFSTLSSCQFIHPSRYIPTHPSIHSSLWMHGPVVNGWARESMGARMDLWLSVRTDDWMVG